MDKRQKNILIWVLTWAGLLLVVLYSPVGSPDLYAPMHYYSENQGVAFNGTDIPNAPRVSVNSDNGSQTNSVPFYESDMKSSLVGSTSYESNSKRNSGSSYGSAGYSVTQSKGGAGSSIAGISSITSLNSKSTSTSQGLGVMSMSTDLSMAQDNNSSTKQGVGYSGGSGATDPGDDPTGPPIPVGEGWIFLLALASVYVVWKKLKF